MSLTAGIFGALCLVIFLWSFRHGMLKVLAASVLFAQWGLSLGSQLIMGVDTPIEMYWAADFTSAMLFFWLFTKFDERWLFAIGVLFTGMVGLHWLYLGGLHAYYHYWAITTLFAIQLLIVRAWNGRETVGVGDIHKRSLSRRRSDSN